MNEAKGDQIDCALNEKQRPNVAEGDLSQKHIERTHIPTQKSERAGLTRAGAGCPRGPTTAFGPPPLGQPCGARGRLRVVDYGDNPPRPLPTRWISQP